MTFTRALAIAFMAGEFAKNDDWGPRAAAALIAAAVWLFLTSDPLPAAIDRGLQSFAKRYRNG
jgi:hypothetical protein